MAVDFSNLAPLKVSSDAKPFTFYGVSLDGQSDVVIHSRPGDTTNEDYQNETLRRAAERAGQGRGLTAASMRSTRDEDREVMALTCATGWDHVVDAAGVAPEFSAEACLEFFQALPDDIFDRYRAWVVNPDNFRTGRIAASGEKLGN